jgi:glycosyltransferase involved in cell wall biosynthesis
MPSEERQDLIAPMQSAFDWGKALGWWVGSRHVLDDAAAVLCVGQREQELVQERLPSQRVEYLPNGVDPLRFAQGDRARFRRERGIPEDARVLLTMGRIDPQKNQALAVRTLAILRREEPRLHLVLIGPVTSSTYRAELERIAQDLGLAEFVHILPGMRADDPALVDAYHAADVFVLPSVHEPFGIVILEAWCAGLPVLASRVGGIPYFVEDGVDGALFDPHDETDLVRAYHALASGRMRECAAAGRAKALREYTWDAVVTRLIRIYEEVVNAHSVRQ